MSLVYMSQDQSNDWKHAHCHVVTDYMKGRTSFMWCMDHQEKVESIPVGVA